MEPEKADNSLLNLSLCYERKPQFEFKCVLADNSFSPFEHFNVSSSTEKCHPFRKEIGALIDNPPEHSFWTSFTKEDTSKDCMWVDSSLQLRELANKLAEQNVFAVDTEQQNLRSYLGFTALMQISTREEDYLVDTVALHDEMALLRPIFSNPRICKACLVLEKPQKSLEGLLQTICNVDLDKSLRVSVFYCMCVFFSVVSSVLSMLNLSLQTRDWTERPLPPTMLRYARTDMQYLLWIADAVKLANREQYDCRERAWKLCIWRDLMARIHDESREFVLSNEAMLEFARKVPTTYDVFKSTDDADQQRGGKIDEVSAIFLCHYDDYFNQIMSDKSVALDTAFPLILQKCLGMNGTCGINLLNCGKFHNYSFFPSVKSGKQTSNVSQIPIRKPDVAVYESDGTLKFWCNHGKGQWYLKTGLAEQTQIHGEYALQLKTETLGGPEKVDKKKDLCNSCGKEGIELNRHGIIVERHYGRSNLSREDLEGVRKIGLMSSKEEKNETSVEKQIINNLLKNSGEDGVKRFCEAWRQQFVNDLHPTNLPTVLSKSHLCVTNFSLEVQLHQARLLSPHSSFLSP
ncbi:unnamed protein product [Brassica oleracea]